MRSALTRLEVRSRCRLLSVGFALAIGCFSCKPNGQSLDGSAADGASASNGASPGTGSSTSTAFSTGDRSANADGSSMTPTTVVATDAAAALDVLSRASASWDGGPKVVASGVVDGAALRGAHRARLATPSPVTIVRGATAAAIGEKLCEAVVPHRAAGTQVLLKPNIGGFDWFKDPSKNGGDDGIAGRITDPEFVRGVIRCLRARGHTKITVAEGWGATHKDWEKLARVSGYEKMTTEEKIPLVAMDDDGVFDVAGDQPGKPLRVSGMEGTHVPTLLMPKILAEHLEHGLFISLPKIKAHRFGVVSMSVKGMQGTVMLSDASPAFRQKWRMHRELGAYLEGQKKKEDDRAAYVASLEIFAERIADVLEIEAPDVVLAEGAPAMGGDGFQKLYPSAELYGVGGTNPISVDRVGSALLGLWDVPELGKEIGGHTSSPLIEVAAKRFGVDVSKPVVNGDGAALFDAPRPIHFVAMAPFAIHRDAKASATPLPTERPIAHAARGTAVIDGKPDDAAWSRAPSVSWETDTSGAATNLVTHARFLWSPAALYALFEIEGTGLNVDASRPTTIERAGLYTEDCVELFLGLEPARPRHYYELELGPRGHYFDLEVDRTPGAARREDTGWSAGLTVATSSDAASKRATIEVAIASPDVVRAATPNARLALGLFRLEGKAPRHYLAWSPAHTAKPDFHVPDAFGTLVLDP